MPNVFNIVAKIFIENPKIKLVVGQAYIVNQNGKLIGELRSKFSSWEDIATSPTNHIRQISTFFSKSLFDELGYLDTTLDIALDTELLVRFTKYYTPLVISDYFSAFRVHSGSKTASQLITGYQETDRVRPRLLNNKSMVCEFNKVSSRNWLSLAENATFEKSVRKKCLFRSIRKYPKILLRRRFWASVKRVFS